MPRNDARPEFCDLGNVEGESVFQCCQEFVNRLQDACLYTVGSCAAEYLAAQRQVSIGYSELRDEALHES